MTRDIQPNYDATLKLARNVYCPCGFLLMETPIGTLYKAVSISKRRGTLICGGCRRRHDVTIILCDQKLNPELRAAYLVFDVMEVVPD